MTVLLVITKQVSFVTTTSVTPWSVPTMLMTVKGDVAFVNIWIIERQRLRDLINVDIFMGKRG